MQYMDKHTGEVLTKVSEWEIVPGYGAMASFQAFNGALLSHCKSDVEPVKKKAKEIDNKSPD